MTAKTQKKTRKEKKKTFRIQLLNIKLLSNTRSGESAYLDLITKLYQNKVMKPIKGGKHAALRTQFITEFDGQKLVYGKFAKFTKITEKDWINIQNMEVENVEIPKDKFPNLVEGDYFFVPAAHRLAIIKTGKLTINSAYAYFAEALKEVIEPTEQHEVVVEQSADIFEKIIHANSIRSLHIKISYTNADLLDEYAEFMDEEIRTMNARSFAMDITPDQNNNISLDSKIVSGSLGVAKSNGEVRAVIKDENNKRRTINTQQHPEVIELTAPNPDAVGKTILKKILGLFRHG